MNEREAMNSHRVEWFVAGDCLHCGSLPNAVEAGGRGLSLEFYRVPVRSALDRTIAPRQAVQRLHTQLEPTHADR